MSDALVLLAYLATIAGTGLFLVLLAPPNQSAG
jgi:hypothetical protein